MYHLYLLVAIKQYFLYINCVFEIIAMYIVYNFRFRKVSFIHSLYVYQYFNVYPQIRKYFVYGFLFFLRLYVATHLILKVLYSFEVRNAGSSYCMCIQ